MSLSAFTSGCSCQRGNDRPVSILTGGSIPGLKRGVPERASTAPGALIGLPGLRPGSEPRVAVEGNPSSVQP